MGPPGQQGDKGEEGKIGLPGKVTLSINLACINCICFRLVNLVHLDFLVKKV